MSTCDEPCDHLLEAATLSAQLIEAEDALDAARAEVTRLREALGRIAKVDGSVGQGRIRDIARRALTPPTPPRQPDEIKTCPTCNQPTFAVYRDPPTPPVAAPTPKGFAAILREEAVKNGWPMQDGFVDPAPLAGRVARHLEDEPEPTKCETWCGFTRVVGAGIASGCYPNMASCFPQKTDRSETCYCTAECRLAGMPLHPRSPK